MANVTYTNVDYQQASIQNITETGYKKALASDSNGLYASITSFRVAAKSVPTSIEDNPYGDTVYFGSISDYEVLDDNVILFTLIVPPEVQNATIDSLSLFLKDGTMFSQGFLKTPRKKVFGVACYIYAYVNAPEPLTNVEARLKVRSTFPQVENYADLPPAHEAASSEYIVNNGHCGDVGGVNNPEYLPVMVIASSGPPKTPVYPPDAPATRVASGSMVSGQYTYVITAKNAGGETLPSPSSTIHLIPLQSTVTQVVPGPGPLDTGTYYYTVTAQTPGGGETLPSAEVSCTVTRLDIPDAPSYTIDLGGIPAGTYEYCVSALSEYGETTPSSTISVTVPSDSGVELTWPAVAGARGYRVYVKQPGAITIPPPSFSSALDPRSSKQRYDSFTLLFEANSTTTVAYDWGNPVNTTIAPRSVRSDAGVFLSWKKVPGATSYGIYGRDTGIATRHRLAIVPGSLQTWRDTGVAESSILEPTVNGTNSGVTLSWAPVEGATSYSVYGRFEDDLHLLADSLSTTSWTDDGSIPATGDPPPTDNQTTEWEWQMVDGTIVYRGEIQDATLTTFTASSQPTPTPVTTTNKGPHSWDLGFMAFTSGPMKGKTRHIKHVKGTDGDFTIIDRQFDAEPVDGTSITIWAGPGCCGGICGQTPNPESVVYPQPPRPPILTAPDYSWLGVHFCGLFLGESGITAAQTNDASFIWNNANAPDVVRNGVMDQLFCNERGAPAYDVPLDNQTITPHGNRLPPGEYSSTLSAASNAVLFTLDSIAIAPGIRCIVFSQPNFTGDILLDVTGPFYVCNWIYREDSRFSWALDASIWHGQASQIIPGNRRFWSDRVRVKKEEIFGLITDLQLWRNGSIRIVQTW